MIPKIDVARYISGASSICREERQYALFLNNILLGIGGKLRRGKPLEAEESAILDACGLSGAVHISRVFYEATFMRDIFDCLKDSHSFNHNLLDYIRKRWELGIVAEDVLKLPMSFKGRNGKEYEKRLSDIQLGRVGEKKVGELSTSEDAKKALNMARAMMNSKPDLAVIYRKGGAGSFLRFIECKYTSPEGGGEVKQTEAQEWIADFLCKNVFKNVSLEEGRSAVSLVHFISDLNRKKRDKKRGIEISTLIDLNAELFK